MVNTSNFTVQKGSTVAFEQALHLGDKGDSHWVMRELRTLSFSSTALPLLAPSPQKSASYEGYLQTRIWTVRNEVKLSSTLMEEAEAGLVSNTEFESTKM